ncbi:hypothetical protein HOY80DRAFT_3578 [Tuber brumale]|nr:hypothetical protein HOY80DRAFT_3578 [Tuber brumale]
MPATLFLYTIILAAGTALFGWNLVRASTLLAGIVWSDPSPALGRIECSPESNSRQLGPRCCPIRSRLQCPRYRWPGWFHSHGPRYQHLWT